MKLIPMFGKILVKPKVDEGEKVKNGIIIPESAKQSDSKMEGEVLRLSGGSQRTKDGVIVPFTVKEGDKILYSIYGGMEIIEDKVKFFIMSEEDILAIIE